MRVASLIAGAASEWAGQERAPPSAAAHSLRMGPRE